MVTMPKSLGPAGVLGLCYPEIALDMNWWTSIKEDERARALRLCFQCPLMVACRQQAEERGEDDSIAGGVDWKLVTKPPADDGKQRARCPKCFRRVEIKEGLFARHYISIKLRRFCLLSSQPFFEAVNGHAV